MSAKIRVCPYCNEGMVKARLQNEEGDWFIAWLCGCSLTEEDYAEIDQFYKEES
jgi:hypothetical protein